MLLKRYAYPLAAGALIVGGVALRLALILIGWPHGNSEEGTMGVEALHILQRGEHPIYLYGQNYMGVGEAYLGAFAFRLFGVSTAALRLGMVACYAMFMVGVFWLAHLLYTRRVALVSLTALVLGTPFVVQIELLADGGKAETMAFGALMFALAAWLALSHDAALLTGRGRVRRYAAFVGWGLCAGLGLYTYAIIAPFVLTSGLLLWLTCRRELRGWASALALAGLLLGLLPAILYTATMPLADNPIAVFLSLHQSLNAQNAPGWYLLVKQIDGALLYTLPTVTGLLDLYPVQALPLYGPPSLSTAVAALVGGGWSVVYLLLLGVATARPLRALRSYGAPRRWLVALPDAAKDTPRDVARLLLALTAWLTIAAYTVSATAANNPHSGRYMIGLLVVAPAILWPLLERNRRSPLPRTGEGLGVGTLGRPIAAALLGLALILGALSTVQSIPQATHLDRKDARFASDLLSRGVTRFYSDYWTCDLLNFNTQERLTCAVVNDYAQPGLTRYHPYAVAVRADPSAPYVLPQNSSVARTFALYAAQNRLRYTAEPLDGYIIFTLLPS